MLVLWQDFMEEVIPDEEVEVHGGAGDGQIWLWAFVA
jgi:hypothetical protein